MTQPNAQCPSCGAAIAFAWSSSVQTTCKYCNSIVVRTDVDLRAVGVVSDLPPDISPIQIGTEGRYDKRSFTVAGRIIYSYDEGTWNEWHIVMNDGQSGWLSDAQALYAVTFPVQQADLPKADQVRLQKQFVWNGLTYVVTAITNARYRGVEGELPFEYWDKSEAVFADLRSPQGWFATLDYGDDEPVLYIGRMVDFDELQFKNLRLFEGWV
jgi:hypothetical protein